MTAYRIGSIEELIDYLDVFQTRPIIFLDIDGVLNTADSLRCIDDRPELVIQSGKLPGDVLDLRNLLLFEATLGRIEKKYEPPIIVGVSSWFTKHKHVDMFNNMVAPYFEMNCKAMVTCGGLHRGKHVLELVRRSNISRYVIIDDAGENMYEPTEPLLWDHLVQVDGRIGFSATDCLKVMKILSKVEK